MVWRFFQFLLGYTYVTPLCYSLFRLSRWNHTKFFSDMDDEETENSDSEYMDDQTVSGRRGKASSQLKSKASLLRSVVIWCLLSFGEWLSP